MGKGKIVYLNGVSSSGKTSIVSTIQSRKDIFFYAVSFDMFEETIPAMHADEDIYYSESIIAMYYAAKKFSDFGRNVLIDGLIMNLTGLNEHYKKVQEIFHDYSLDIVEIYCPLEICKQRNIARGDRAENQSDCQSGIMEKNIKYSYSVDTSVYSTDECVEIIINKSIMSGVCSCNNAT